MAGHLIKTIKHGIMVLSIMLENANCWDEQLAKVMFRYRCGIQANNKFSPFMILTRCTPHLKADNYLHSLTAMVDDCWCRNYYKIIYTKDEVDCKRPWECSAQCKTCTTKAKEDLCYKRGKQTFEGLVAGQTMVKMKKPRKKKALTSSWEGPY
jgi:hypothetical protein